MLRVIRSIFSPCILMVLVTHIFKLGGGQGYILGGAANQYGYDGRTQRNAQN